MAYVGSTVRITAQAKDYDNKTILTPPAVGAKVSVALPADQPPYTALFEDYPMLFDETNEWFYYDWPTGEGGLQPGNYQIKVEISGEAYSDIQFSRVLLQAPRF